MFKFRRLLPTLSALLIMPDLALAHPGHADHYGFVSGFTHPIFGLDHVLAMVLVGLIAARIGGRALIVMPLSFVSMMVLGGVLAFEGVDVSYVEFGIASSLIAFGLVLALNITVPVAAAVLVTGSFAIFHGFAHGAEMPKEASAIGYALGFVAATALLHVVGIGAWTMTSGRRMTLSWAIRAIGGFSAAMGAALIMGFA